MTEKTVFFEKSEEAVERLKVKAFINRYKKEIFAKLEELSANSTITEAQSGGQQDKNFLIQCLPIMSSIVQVGSNSQDLPAATAWVATKLPEVDAVTGLCSLTLVYLIEAGWQEYKDSTNEKKRAVWETMHTRVRRLFGTPGGNV